MHSKLAFPTRYVAIASMLLATTGCTTGSDAETQAADDRTETVQNAEGLASSRPLRPGEIDWTRYFPDLKSEALFPQGTNGRAAINDFAIFDDGSAVLVGPEQYDEEGFPQIVVLKTDRLGHFVWRKALSGRNDGISSKYARELVTGVAVDPLSNIYVITSRYTLTKLRQDGTILWKSTKYPALMKCPYALPWMPSLRIGAQGEVISSGYADAPWAAQGNLGCSAAIHRFDAANGDVSALFVDSDRKVYGDFETSSIASDGTIFAGSNKDVWAFASDGRKRFQVDYRDLYISTLVASPDGGFVVAGQAEGGSSGVVRKYDSGGLRLWEFRASMKATSRPVAGLGFSSLAVASDGNVYAGATRENKLGQIEYTIQAFSPNGLLLWTKSSQKFQVSGLKTVGNGLLAIGRADGIGPEISVFLQRIAR